MVNTDKLGITGIGDFDGVENALILNFGSKKKLEAFVEWLDSDRKSI